VEFRRGCPMCRRVLIGEGERDEGEDGGGDGGGVGRLALRRAERMGRARGGGGRGR